jgi:manganese transport protein
VASIIFAFALLASGQNSTLTGTLAGQIVMEGFLNIRLTPWLRRLITRGLAVVPAVGIMSYYGESHATSLIVWSQVILSMQLGFAIWPLMRFTDDKTKMGEFANRPWLRIVGWTTVAVIIVLNLWLLFTSPLVPDSVQDPVFKFLGWPVPAP